MRNRRNNVICNINKDIILLGIICFNCLVYLNEFFLIIVADPLDFLLENNLIIIVFNIINLIFQKIL